MEQCYHFTHNIGVGHKSVKTQDDKVVVQYTNTILLGKTLIEAMLKEVDGMILLESSKSDWSDSIHEQVLLTHHSAYTEH